MSSQQGSGGLSQSARGIPPHGVKRNDGGKSRPNKYRDLKPSEQQNTSGQRRMKRKAGQ